MALFLSILLLLCNNQPVFAQDAGDADAKAQARELFAKGREATKTGDGLLSKGQRDQAMDAYGSAITSFLEAYGVVQSPLLLYSLGQVYRSRGENHWAQSCYQQFLADAAMHESASEAGQMIHRFVPDATERAAELEALLAGLEAPAASESPLDPVGVCYPKPAPPKPEPPKPVVEVEVVEPVQPEPIVEPESGSGRTGYRIGFWTTGTLAAASFIGATVTFLQVRGSLEDEKIDAINAYQTMSNDQLAVRDACADASTKQSGGMGGALLDAVVSACDKGQSRATLSNVYQGVALVSAAAAGYLFYKGYLQKSSAGQEERTVLIQPMLTPDSAGAQMMLRF